MLCCIIYVPDHGQDTRGKLSQETELYMVGLMSVTAVKSVRKLQRYL